MWPRVGDELRVYGRLVTMRLRDNTCEMQVNNVVLASLGGNHAADLETGSAIPLARSRGQPGQDDSRERSLGPHLANGCGHPIPQYRSATKSKLAADKVAVKSKNC